MTTTSLCPNCESTTHACCCEWCGKIHKPPRRHYEHCSMKCMRAAEKADQLSAALEEEWEMIKTDPKLYKGLLP